MAGYALLASGAMLAFAYSQEFELSPAMKFAPWLMFCRQLMLGSVAMLLSLFCPPIVAAVLAFFAGNGLYSRYNPLYYILPSYGDFDLWSEVFSGTLVSGRDQRPDPLCDRFRGHHVIARDMAVPQKELV